MFLMSFHYSLFHYKIDLPDILGVLLKVTASFCIITRAEDGYYTNRRLVYQESIVASITLYGPLLPQIVFELLILIGSADIELTKPTSVKRAGGNRHITSSLKSGDILIHYHLPGVSYSNYLPYRYIYSWNFVKTMNSWKSQV